MQSRNVFGFLTGVTLVLLGPGALAQDATNGATPDSSGRITQLEEIVVTAQRREQNVQDVPASVTALSGTDLEERGLTSIVNYSNFVPGMVFNSQTSGGERTGPNIAIRGVANTRLGPQDTNLGTNTTSYVYGQVPVFPLDARLVDVNRIEVLKGPQGTLYGSTSMGGTVKVVPNDPSASDFSAVMKGGLGTTTDGGRNTEYNLVANFPVVTGVLGVRFMGAAFQDSGYIDERLVKGDPNELRGGIPLLDNAGIPSGNLLVPSVIQSNQEFVNNANWTDTTLWRIAAKYTPTEKLEAILSFTNQRKDTGNTNNFEPGLSGPTFNGRFAEGYTTSPSSEDYSIASLEAKYDLGFAHLNSVSGVLNRKYQHTFDFTPQVYGGLGGPSNKAVPGTATNNTNIRSNVISQELRLENHASFLAGLDWTVGAFYEREQKQWNLALELSQDWIKNATAEGLRLPATGIYIAQANNYTHTYTQRAAFANISLSFTPKWILDFGARRTTQDVNTALAAFGGLGPTNSGVVPTTTSSVSEPSTTPRVALSYKASDDIMAYVNYSEGFRIGGGAPPPPSSLLFQPFCQDALRQLGIEGTPGVYKSDSISNRELGFKSTLLNKRVKLNAAVYQVDWSGLQVNTILQVANPLCATSIVTNIGAARIRGMELELKALLTDNVELATSAEFNDAKLTDITATAPLAHPGDRLRDIPKIRVASGIQYNFRAVADMSSYVRLDYVHVGDMSDSDLLAGPDPKRIMPAYDLVNFRFGGTINSLSFEAFVDNALDKNIWSSIDYRPRGPGIYADGNSQEAFIGLERPRTYGITVSRKF